MGLHLRSLLLLLFAALAAPSAWAGPRVTRETPKVAEASASTERKLAVPEVGKAAIAGGIDAIGDAAGLDLGNSKVIDAEGRAEIGLKTRVEAANGGFVEVELVRGEIAGKTHAGTVKNGVAAAASGSVDATIAAVKADTGRVVAGDPKRAFVDGQASGEAELRGKAQANASAKATTHAIEASAGGTAFIGARAGGKVDGKATLCGVSVVGKGDGELSVGAGASASAQFAIDWTNLKFRAGANAAATLGVGGGAGGNVEISLENLKKDPRAAGSCALQTVESVAGRKAAHQVAKTAKQAAAVGEQVAQQATAVREQVEEQVADVGEQVAKQAQFAVENLKQMVRSLPGIGGSNVSRGAKTAAVGTASRTFVPPAAGAGMKR